MTSDLRDADGLGFFLYRSEEVPDLPAAQIREILSRARVRNQELGLTGCIHNEAGLFFQWLEGPSQALVKVRTAIEADSRHRNFKLLDQGPLTHRRFQGWRMRASTRDAGSLMEWFARSDSATVDPADYVDGIVAFMQSLDS